MGRLTLEQVTERVAIAVIEILESSLGQTIDLDDNLDDLDLDSLDIVEMTMDIEQHFNLDVIDDEELDSCITVNDLVLLVSDKVNF